MTEEERTKIIVDMTAKGVSCAKIAPHVECSAGKVNIIQNRLGIQRSGKRVLEKERPTRAELLACNGMTTEEICAEYRRGFYVIKRWLKDFDIARIRYGCRAGQMVDLAKVRALAEVGQCAAQIGPIIGFSPSVVTSLARENAIDLPIGDPQSHSRERPEKADFLREFSRNSRRELASIYGVTEASISRWALQFGLRQAAPSRRPRLLHKDVCTRPIAGSCSAGAIERALVKVGAR